MLDSNIQSYVDTQNKAYTFQAKKIAETEAQKTLSLVQTELLKFKQQLETKTTELLENSKQYAETLVSDKTKVCLVSDSCSVKDEDYPLGTILSVAAICSEEEGKELFLQTGPSVNEELSNLYTRIDDDSSAKQVFHWARGKEIQSEAYRKLPGEWRNRGMCGSFNGNIVSCKYFLAQRVK